MDQIKPGNPAPDFTLPGSGENRISLSDYRGRIVVLFFYPKDDTSGCTAEAISFSGLKAEFDALGATVIGLSPDSVKSHDRFRAKHELTVDLASDEEKEVLQAYGVWVQKSMYGRKYMGVERTTVLIDRSGTITRVWNKVKVPGHAAEVLEAVKALG
ncbi:MAG: peroxiredoxin [Aquamicrobium sp.]|uniref:peroxiredoxin n=1 Tax=Aquamicrobium sp. TaxID=1872579 RepID=UPI00349EE18F|nr:peroxiredoxin [Aquamicrobium sp.]